MVDDLASVALVCAVVAAGLYLITRIRYAIDDSYLRVVWFGRSVRKIALSDIESVRAGRTFWNEHWDNTLWPFSRSVTIRRRSGWFRNFVITPGDRDAFIAELRAKLGVG